MKIRHLFISPGHNFFGHHGQPPGTYPVEERDEIECAAGSGIRGDRFFDFKPDYKGQITFFAWEDLVRMWDEIGVPDDQRDPSATRRNVITEDVDLQALIGKEFSVQGVRFLGMEECRPCYWMNGAIRPGAEDWMKGRGGLRASILTSGQLKVGACFDLLTPLCQSVWVSARAGQAREGFPLLMDRYGGRGPLDGILSAMEAHPGHAWLVVACDMPRLDAQTLRLLVARRDPSRLATAFRSPYDHRPEPLCAIYEPAIEPALRRALEGGRASARDVLMGNDSLLLDLPDAQALDNANDPAEYEEMRHDLQA